MLFAADSKTDKENHLSEYANKLIRDHVSGRLKVAPEHTSDEVLKIMRKPSFSDFKKFRNLFNRVCRDAQLQQQIIPYFISSHPGCKLEHMVDLAIETKGLGFHLEQVQDFTPTPMTLATEIFYSGFDPYSLKPVYVARTDKEKHEQQIFFFWYKKENFNWIKNTLHKIKKDELIPKLIKTNSHKPAENISKKIKNKFSRKKR
jgi:radical SAM superfamily enzyme YgiQ (UPF0313 family)